MEYAVIIVVACGASALTFFAGFGLGTLLLPAFALFFPIPVAVALTAFVHFLNGLFKLTLVGRHISWPVALRFGVPAVVAAFVGAELLLRLTDLAPIARYQVSGHALEITPVKLVIAVLMFGFALIELSPRVQHAALPPRWLPVGGVISGLFGGLSGHQGAFRSAFLLRAGLDKQAFIATGVAAAVLVDVTRIAVYLRGDTWQHLEAHGAIVAVAAGAAFIGAYAGNRLLEKVTLRAIQLVVAVMLMLMAIAIGSGVL